jgi:hypothetical protein
MPLHAWGRGVRRGGRIKQSEAAVAVTAYLTPDPGRHIICIPALSGWVATSQSAQHSAQESQTLGPPVHIHLLPITQGRLAQCHQFMQRLLFHRLLRRIPNALLRECQAPENEASLSPPSNAGIKNEWSCTSSPPIYLYGAYRDNFNFYTLTGLLYGTELAKHYSNLAALPIHLLP